MPLFVMPRTQQVTSSGQPAQGYYLKFFETDGTTQKTVYSDEDLTTAIDQSNGIVADAAGRFEAIYVSGSYKVRLYDTNDVVIFTETTSQSGLDDAFYEEIVANGSNPSFTLSEDLGTDEKAVVIELPDGTTYAPTDFTIDGTSLTFNSNPDAGTYKVRAPSLNLGAASSYASAAETAKNQAESYAVAVGAGGAIGDITTLSSATPVTTDYILIADVSDSNINKKVLLSAVFTAVFTAFTSQTNTFTAAQRGSLTELTDGATITPDFDDSNDFYVKLEGNRTFANPDNVTVGQSGSIRIHQDSTGSRTAAFAWGWKPTGGNAIDLSTTAGAMDMLYYNVAVAQSSEVTITIASPGVVSYTGHGLYTGQQIQLTTTGTLPTGLTASTTYYVIEVDDDSFQLATSLANAVAGTAINTSSTQSGTHTLTALTIHYSISLEVP